MSKLEDKLSATLKPPGGKVTPSARPGAKPASKQPATGGPRAAPAPKVGPDSAVRPLHPRRVWPD